MSTNHEIGTEKQTVEVSLNNVHNQLKAYINDQITVLDDIISIIESFYKTEKHAHERMQSTLQKSLEHTHHMSYLGPSIIGVKWGTAVKDLMDHYAQREASYPLLKQLILEDLRKIKSDKADEHYRVLLYDEEIIKEMTDVERRAIKSRRAYEEACERLRQYHNPNKEKKSGIERVSQMMSPKNELGRLENAVVDTRNLYILHVRQMNSALTFYFEQFIADLDKLLVCDIFHRINKVLDDLAYVEYKRLRDTLQSALTCAIENGDEQKRRLLPKSFQSYPLHLLADHTDQINTEEKHILPLQSAYQSALNEVRDAEQQVASTLEASVTNAQLNKDSKMDATNIRLKRVEMRRCIANFMVETLESILPNLKTMPARNSSKLMASIKPFITPTKTESQVTSSISPLVGLTAPKVSLQADIPSIPIFPCQAIVLYDFESAHDDEMSVRKDEKIFIESKTEHDGWLIARGRERSGLVPSAYVQLVCPETGKYVTIPSSVSDSSENQTTLVNSAMPNNAASQLLQEEMEYFSDDD